MERARHVERQRFDDIARHNSSMARAPLSSHTSVCVLRLAQKADRRQRKQV